MEQQRLIFNTRDEMLRIDVEHIVYIEADGNYSDIVTSNKLRGSMCMNLGQMEAALEARLTPNNMRCFARIGKKYIVNLKYVYRIVPLKKQLVLTDFTNFTYQLDLSRDALKRLKEMMLLIKM